MRTTEDAERWLFDAIEAMDDDDSDAPYAVSTYEDAGVLTRDRGLVLRFASGLEVQVTIVRSANPRAEGE